MEKQGQKLSHFIRFDFIRLFIIKWTWTYACCKWERETIIEERNRKKNNK